MYGFESVWEGYGCYCWSEEGVIVSGRWEEGEVFRVGVCWIGMKGG